ncbi:ABC transporter permease, partial [Sphaerisporangium melleum]|uniref:ABC transporter permease n=1 Tax=Sphaerisporangium melleum TaxID=321316 RepID=UPI0035E53125
MTDAHATDGGVPRDAGASDGTEQTAGGVSQDVPPPADEHTRVETQARAAAPNGSAGPGLLGRVGQARHIGLVVALALLAVIGLVTVPENFATSSNLVSILALASTIGVITVGMTFVIIGGGIDLSVGAIMALASVWATTLATQAYGPFVMIICAVLVGTGAGLVNGLLISYGRMVPFIATLAMLVAARGLAQRMSDRKTQLVQQGNEAIVELSTTRVLGLPLLVYIFAAVVAVGWLVLNRTTFGRRTYAVGGNPEAARLAGIDVRRHTLLLYALSGLCCGIAAVLIMA